VKKKIETVLAIFYNFKDESTCPFCRIVKDMFDEGGRKMVLQQLATKYDENYKHSFIVCFIQHYWITEVYKKTNHRELDTVVKEGLLVFDEMTAMLSVK
jgi:thiol-disulfide isomerase/thioredoxin